MPTDDPEGTETPPPAPSTAQQLNDTVHELLRKAAGRPENPEGVPDTGSSGKKKR